MENRILLCPLISDDYHRSVRAIKSCFNQKDHYMIYGVHVVINSLDLKFIEDISNFCESNSIKYSVTECDGSPGKGKNSVFDIFQNSEYTHMSQLDGDDIFYPTFLKQVQRHLKKYPTTDVLATLPCDSIFKHHEENMFKLENGYSTAVWGTHYVNWETPTMLGEDKIFLGTSNGNYARFVLFSKKISENFRYDPSFIVGEDFKLHFDFLYSFQKDDINYWFTAASDMWVRDTTSFGIQKKHSNTIVDGEYIKVRDDETMGRLINYVETNMMRYRSAPGEIPIDFAPIYMSFEEKNKFLNEVI